MLGDDGSDSASLVHSEVDVVGVENPNERVNVRGTIGTLRRRSGVDWTQSTSVGRNELALVKIGRWVLGEKLW